MSSLQEPSNEYTWIRMFDGASWYSMSTSSSTTCYGTISGLSPGTLYSVEGWAKWGVTAYHIGTVSVRTDYPPTPTLAIPTRNYANTSETTLSVSLSHSVSGVTFRARVDDSPFQENTSGNFTFTGFSAGSNHTLGYQAVKSGYNDSSWGEYNFTTDSHTRPSNWSWWSNVAQGADVNMGAQEWNSFTSRINSFRDYKYMDPAYFSNVSSGGYIWGSHPNQAIDAIAAMNPSVALPAKVYSDYALTAAMYIGLKNSLNSV